MTTPTQEITPRERARRQKRNRRRKLDRQKVAEGRALPPVVGLGRSQYLAMFGADADYDAYADAFIAGAKKARRRWEFPLEPLAGAWIGNSSRCRNIPASWQTGLLISNDATGRTGAFSVRPNDQVQP